MVMEGTDIAVLLHAGCGPMWSVHTWAIVLPQGADLLLGEMQLHERKIHNPVNDVGRDEPFSSCSSHTHLGSLKGPVASLLISSLGRGWGEGRGGT